MLLSCPLYIVSNSASLWFVWVRFGSRKVNEPEIGSVSVCIPTVCLVESKLMDAVWPPYAILIAMGKPRKVRFRDESHQWGVEPGCGFQFNPEK